MVDPDPAQLLLSVVVPVYNERLTLRELVRRVVAVDLDKEIIIVDDGSTDGTSEIAKGLCERYPEVRLIVRSRNGGKGAAIRTGLAEAQGEFLIIQDGDLEYDPADYEQVLEPLVTGKADAVFGSRFMSGPRRVHMFWHMVANKGLTLLTNVAANLNLTDMETCYKAFRTDLIKSIPLRSNGFDFEPEVTMKLAKLGVRIYEVPISYNGRDHAEGKKIGLRDAWIAVLTIARYWLSSDVGDAGYPTLVRMSELGEYNRVLFEACERFVGQQVADIGAGVGNISRFLVDRERLVLCDLDESYLRILRRRFGRYENVSVVSLDLDHYDRSALGGEVDTIICTNVLEHIEDDSNLLRHMHDSLCPGGRLIIVVPAHSKLYCDLDRHLGHFRRYGSSGLQSQLEAAGFEVEQCQHFNQVGALGWFVFGRLLGRRQITKIATTGFRLAARVWPVRTNRRRFGLSLLAVGRRVEDDPAPTDEPVKGIGPGR